MMPSLHFYRKKQTKMESKCMFCRGRNILCSGSSSVYRRKQTKCKKLTEKFSFTGMPDSLLLHIFQFLDLHSLLIARQVNRSWKRIAEDRQLWKTTNFSCKRVTDKSWIFSFSNLHYPAGKCDVDEAPIYVNLDHCI